MREMQRGLAKDCCDRDRDRGGDGGCGGGSGGGEQNEGYLGDERA